MSKHELEKAWDFLEQAVKEMKGRKQLYDPDSESDGERSMNKTVQIFNILTNNSLTEEQGWMFMVALKMVRSQSGKYQGDDYVDGSAYFALGGEASKKARGGLEGPEGFCSSGGSAPKTRLTSNAKKLADALMQTNKLFLAPLITQQNYLGLKCDACGYFLKLKLSEDSQKFMSYCANKSCLNKG